MDRNGRGPWLRSRSIDLRDGGARAARRALHFAGVHAARTGLHLLDLAFDDGAHHLKIRLPGATGLVVRVRDVVAERDAPPAAVADVSLNGHGLALHQLDARHLGTVTLAVAGLEDARVTAVSLRELRPDFLEQLVGRRTRLHVTNGKTA